MKRKKLFVGVLIILFCFASHATAQNGDSLVVHFKNRKSVSFSLSDIKKITFDSLKASVTVSDFSKHWLTITTPFPNPVISTTDIEFSISESGKVGVNILNLDGNTIRQLSEKNCKAGKNQIKWDCRDEAGKAVASGVYFYRIQFMDEVQTRNMIVVR
jgi:flagellar hook assembly protein FlgD